MTFNRFRACEPALSNRPPVGFKSLLCTLTLLLGTQLIGLAHAATIEVTSTAADRGTFSELQCLPPGSDVDAGPGATTVTGGATLAAAQADGRVTLREAICVANNTPRGDVIVLSPATYTLSTADNYWYGPNGLPPIGDDITIEGNGAVIERDPTSNPFLLEERFRLFFISRKTLTDGIAIVGGADRAKLTLRDLTLRNGLAQGGEGQAGGAGAGMGGAIFNQGQLVLSRVTLNGNVARGGDSGVFDVVFGGVLFSGVGAGMGRDATDGGGFGPGQFGGAFGGSALFEEAANPVSTYGCGGGAGFGAASGGDAFTEPLDPGFFVVGGAGGGLGRVGGAFFCGDSPVCAGEGDGGAGGSGREDSTPEDGDGRGGSFGLNGSTATGCGGGGGVGAGGAPGSAFEGFKGGAGGFGGGGAAGAAFVGTGGTLAATLGGSGGFGGGGGSSWEPESGGNLPPPGRGGFGGGNGGFAFEFASGGGGAGMGGALFNYGGDVTASNTTWTDNHAIGGSVQERNIASPGAGYGGAIFNLDGILDIAYSTLSGNRVVRGAASSPALPNPAGGAIYNRLQNPGVYGFRSELVIRTSILANSLDGDGLPISDCNVSLHPDVEPNAVTLITGLSVFQKLEIVDDLDGNDHLSCGLAFGSILADPQLLALADNGGPTPTMAIGAGSPAIDFAGNCADPSTDQRGVARPQGAECDAGAFELVRAPAVGLDLSAIDFPSVRVGESSGTQNVTITNTGTADLILGSLTISGSQASEFGIDADNCSGQTLAVSAACSVGIVFSPTAKDARAAQLNIPSNAASSPDSVSLSGTGIQSEVSISLSPADFGEVRMGETSSPLTVTLTNNGSATLNVSALTAAAAPFAQASAGTCGTVPFSVNAGSSCTLPYTFSPTTTSEASQAFTLTSDAEVGSGAFELAGTGITSPAAPTNVSATPGNTAATVSWTPPTDTGGSPITGYTVTGVPDGSCSVADTVTECTITGLTNGTEYTFTVIATNAAGDSPASDPGNIVVPSQLLFRDRFERD